MLSNDELESEAERCGQLYNYPMEQNNKTTRPVN
jgi:hypothetical protein